MFNFSLVGRNTVVHDYGHSLTIGEYTLMVPGRKPPREAGRE